MSCQGRERMFEYAAKTYGTRVAVYRLNYAVDLRYGVLYDMAHNILEETHQHHHAQLQLHLVGTPTRRRCACCGHASAEVFTLNVTGPETAGVQETAKSWARCWAESPYSQGGVGRRI